MADIKIKFRFDIETGQKEILVEYEADPDAMPYEHEQRHREIVEALVGKGVIGADETELVRVERIEPTAAPRDQQSPQTGAEPGTAAQTG